MFQRILDIKIINAAMLVSRNIQKRRKVQSVPVCVASVWVCECVCVEITEKKNTSILEALFFFLVVFTLKSFYTLCFFFFACFMVFCFHFLDNKLQH